MNTFTMSKEDDERLTMQTLAYYNDKHAEYFERTLGLNISNVHEMFESRLPKGGRILDLGAGSGRDTKYFLEKGFEVVAVDGATDLAEYASRKLGITIQVMEFKDIDFQNEFDGVWACSSLLHLNTSSLGEIYIKIHKALKSKGLFYSSFKFGSGTEVDSNGRYFNHMNDDSLVDIAEKTGFETLQILHNMADNGNIFVNWVGRRKI